MMKQRLIGLAALIGLVAVVAGVPAVLIGLGATPLPSNLPSTAEILSRLTRPDDGWGLMVLAVLVAWVAWALFTVLVAVEVVSRLRGIRPPTLRGIRIPQLAARNLVGAVALLFVATSASITTANAAPAPAAPHVAAAPADVQPAHAETAPEQTEKTNPTHVQAPKSSYTVHTVRAGDSLWSLAERYLGDGTRYQEIADINYGVPQADGHALTDEHWLNPGWKLTIPTSAGPDQNDQRHTVTQGESLSSIAQHYLGDPDRWPELAAASRHIAQPGGAHLTNPDQINVGWTIIIPSQEPNHVEKEHVEKEQAEKEQAEKEQAEKEQAEKEQAEKEQAEKEQAEKEQAQKEQAQKEQAAGRGHSESQPTTSQTQDTESPAGEVDDHLDESAGFPIRTAAGVGAVMAAGVISLVGYRRLRQQRIRRAGERIPLPTGATARTEQELRATADAMSIAVVDKALRHLAADHRATNTPLPALRAARLTASQLDLYLAEPAELPAPWSATVDDKVWALQAVDAEDLATTDNTPAPYPALVTVGQDDEDGHILLNLEHAGSLDIDGPADTAREVMFALAVELATSRWADDITVTMVGAAPEMEDILQTGRIRYLPSLGRLVDELTSRAAADRAALAGTDLATARTTDTAPDAWNPEIVLLPGSITENQRAALTELITSVPRVAIAAVTHADALGEWGLTITGTDPLTATMAPAGMTVHPQRLDPDTYAQLLDLVSTADEPAADPESAPSPGLTLVSEPAQPPAIAAESAQDDRTGPAEKTTLDDDTADEEGTSPDEATAASDVSGSTPDVASTDVTLGTVTAAPALQAVPVPTAEDVPSPVPDDVPVFRILGPVALDNAAGTVEPSKRARLLEYGIYLALNPSTTPAAIDEAIWPARKQDDNLNTRNTATSKLRKWMGVAADGELWLPKHQYTYRDQVTSDWQLWQQHVGPDPAKASTASLTAAFSTVRGRPFEGAHPRRYGWAEPVRQEMISAIVDGAWELGHRQLMSGRWSVVEQTMATGLGILPGCERLWRMRILAAHESRNPAAEDEAVSRLLSITDELGDDLEPETNELLQILKEPRTSFDRLKETL